MPPKSVVHDEKSPYETESEYRARRKIEMATASRSTTARRPVQGANFEPKRIRKAKRKAKIRGYVANRALDAQSEFDARMEFFRNLRAMKQQRRKIAHEMHTLADRVRALQREVGSVEYRVPTVDLALVDETRDCVGEALKAAQSCADDFFVFSRQRIYYVKELA